MDPNAKNIQKNSIIQILDAEILLPLLDLETFTELHDLIYCTAFTAAVANGAKINEENVRKGKRDDHHGKEDL